MERKQTINGTMERILSRMKNRRRIGWKKQGDQEGKDIEITLPSVEKTNRSTGTRTSQVPASSVTTGHDAAVTVAPLQGQENNVALGMSCDRNMPLLYSLARNWAWSAVTSRSKTHPEEASAVDHLGDNALHWAAFGKAPIESIQGLLNADPTMASVVNKKGHLPLHVACSCKPTVRVLDALLQAYPDGAGMATSSGSFPLHLMCDFGCTSDAMSVILQSKEARLHVWAKDRLYERRPLELLNCRKNLCDFQHTISTMRRARLRQSAIRRDGDLSSRAITELRRLEKSVQACGFVDFWRKVAILLYVEHTGEAPWMFYRRENSAKEDELMKYGSLFLHASIANQLCPPSLQEYAILLYDKLLLTPVDDDKNLPLHVAARVGTSSVLKDLVNANPQAAMVRNEQGLLPLSLLLRRNSKPGWLDGVNCVLEAFPQALAEQNVDRRFYPFILARFCSSRSTAHVVFCFLRSQPDIIL